MQLDKYYTETTVGSLTYTFESIGRTIIKKVVQYSKMPPSYIGLSSDSNVYNLAFGDWDDEINDFSDQITSNNGDMEKVLATVANTASIFWSEYPNTFIYFEGSQPEGKEYLRTYLYQKKLNRYFRDISTVALVFGLTDYGWELFTVNKNYSAFLISQKD
jgi:hypothetical protein